MQSILDVKVYGRKLGEQSNTFMLTNGSMTVLSGRVTSGIVALCHMSLGRMTCSHVAEEDDVFTALVGLVRNPRRGNIKHL